MDISTAKELLSTLNGNLQKQIDANNVAISILDNAFQAEFTQLETVKATFDAKNNEIVEKASIISTLTTEKTAETTRADTAEALVEEKVSEIVALNDNLIAVQEEVDTKEAIIEDVVTTITTIVEDPDAKIETVKVQLATKIEAIKPVEPTPITEEIVTP